MAKERKEIYCVECGTKNKIESEKCTKCHRKLNPSDHAFKDYVWNKFTGGAQDEFLKLLIRFLKKHLYGVLMSCSVIFTGLAVITNVSNSKEQVEIVTTRPIIKYVGEGLAAKDVVDKYANAIKAKDWSTVYGLQLVKTNPEAYEEIIEYSDNSSPSFGEKKPIKVHTLAKFGDIYFRDGRDYEIDDYEEVTGEGKYGNHQYYRYKLWVDFHEGNSNTGVDTYWLADEVEVVEVDGNYYITGEKHYYEQMNLSDIIIRGMIYNAGGDMTKVHLYDVYDENLCDDMENCIAKFGGMEVSQEW